MLQITSWQTIGSRDYQEDQFVVLNRFAKLEYLTLCLVCDGHGGPEASAFLIKQYPTQLEAMILEHIATRRLEKKQHEEEEAARSSTKEEASDAPKKSTLRRFMEKALDACVQKWGEMCFGEEAYARLTAKDATEEEVKAHFKKINKTKFEQEGKTAGTTLIAMLINMRKAKAYVLNLGDSRAAWKLATESGIMQTTDHNVPQKTKIERPGFSCKVIDGRLQGDLLMSRAFGDYDQKLMGRVPQKGDSYEFDFRGQGFRAVVASDGLWDVLSNQQALFEAYDDAQEIANKGLVVITDKEEEKQANNPNWKREKFKPVYADNTSIIYIKCGLSEEETCKKTQLSKTTKKLNNLTLVESTATMEDTTPASNKKTSRKKKPVAASQRRSASTTRKKPSAPPLSSSAASTYQRQGVTMHFVSRKASKTLHR